MRIGIIGAGRVGVTMGKYLGDAGVEVSGFYSKTTQSAVQAAEFTDTTVYKSLQDIVEASDTLMITTPDGVISEVWDCIAGYDLTGKILCHCSGSLSSNVFSGIDRSCWLFDSSDVRVQRSIYFLSKFFNCLFGGRGNAGSI